LEGGDLASRHWPCQPAAISKGRIVKPMGDGAIVEFASVADAVALPKAVATDQTQFPSE
jgi:hypothetical protein